MEHSKGKLTQGKSNTLLYINGINFGDVLVGGLPHEECEANAAELVHRWNEHDSLKAKADSQPALLKACEAWEKAVKHGEIMIKDLGTEMLTGEAIEKTKAAIEATKSKT